MSWRLARSLQTLRDEVRARWPSTTVWTVGDADHQTRASDHNPADHDDDPATPEVVTAIDVVGGEQARGLWRLLNRTRDVRVEYAIFDGRIVGADTGWDVRPYGGTNPHRGHCHVSVGRGSDGNPTRPDLFDDPAPWGLHTATTDEDDDMALTEIIQRSLNAAGIRDDAGDQLAVDGDPGPKTEQALTRAFKLARRDRVGLTQTKADARYLKRGQRVNLDPS